MALDSLFIMPFVNMQFQNDERISLVKMFSVIRVWPARASQLLKSLPRGPSNYANREKRSRTAAGTLDAI